MLICFHAPSPLVYFGLFRINTMAHTLGMSIQQHQQKSLLKFYVLPRAKKEPLSRKILGKAVQNAVGKGTGPSNLPKPILASFCHASKNGCKKAQKSLKLLGFSQRHLFWCSLMASGTLLDTILSFSVLSTAFRKQTFIEFAVPKQSTVQRTQVQNL